MYLPGRFRGKGESKGCCHQSLPASSPCEGTREVRKVLAIHTSSLHRSLAQGPASLQQETVLPQLLPHAKVSPPRRLEVERIRVILKSSLDFLSLPLKSRQQGPVLSLTLARQKRHSPVPRIQGVLMSPVILSSTFISRPHSLASRRWGVVHSEMIPRPRRHSTPPKIQGAGKSHTMSSHSGPHPSESKLKGPVYPLTSPLP